MILICHRTADRNTQHTDRENILFSTMTKQKKKSGQSDFTGTKGEEKFLITNKSLAKMTRIIFRLKLLQCQMNEKQGDLVCCQKCNVWYYEICDGAKGSSFVVDVTEQSCAAQGSELYRRRYIFDQL